GSVTGRVLDANGQPVAEDRVLFTNLPALQQAATANKTTVQAKDIINVSTKTSTTGEFSRNLPNGIFTAYFGDDPAGSNAISPTVEAFTVANALVALGDVSFRATDLTVTGEINNDLNSPKLIFYATNGGVVKPTITAEHTYSAGLVAGEWNVLVSGINAKDELALYQNKFTLTESGTLNFLTVPSTGVTVPAAASDTCSLAVVCVVSNAAGARVELPPYAAGYSDTVTVQIAPRPNLEVSSGGIAQIGIAYDVNVWNTSSGMKVSQLEQPAKIILPIDQNLTNGNATNELTPSFQQTDLNMFLADGVLGETDGNTMTIYTNHLSQFAVASNITLTKPSLPRKLSVKKITATTANLKWLKPKRSLATRYVVQLRSYQNTDKTTWDKYKKVKTTKKHVKNLTSLTRYQFRARACNNLGCSKFSKWKAFKTK
ncbi:MAG: fibronectin type III domain-containing protein, partial [Patescibacteria group bacterium]